MKYLIPSEVVFSKASMVDNFGKIFFYEGRIFRAIYTDESAALGKYILNEPWIDDAFKAGLVKTWIPTDISMQGTKLILEHQYIPFAMHPAECTPYMHWLMAKTTVQLNKILCQHGLLLKDSHPWNLMFNHGCPQFIDFGSIIQSDNVGSGWLDEFRRYFAVPIWLAFRGKKILANEYRRQHLTGFGLLFFDASILKNTIFRSLMRNGKYSGTPVRFFDGLDIWLERHAPTVATTDYWATYKQSGDLSDPLTPMTPKHQFVYDILTLERPEKVLDCASNKGFYSELAAGLGASVAAFDYEEFCVDRCLERAQSKHLDITPVLMDFRHPSPPSGLGLLVDGSYQRFHSDIVLALGLGHHLCITQGLPVQVFCEICMNYASRGVIFEYVDPTDKHVASWNKPAPSDYSLESFTHKFSAKFPNHRYSKKLTTDGINRTIAYFFV